MRTKKAFLNTFTSLIYQFVTIISGLIVPKLILEAYGSECNGVVSSANQFMGIVSFLTIGLTGAARVELYKSLADNDLEQTNAIVNSTSKYMHKVAGILAVYAVLLAFFYPYAANTSLDKRIIIPLILAVGAGKFFEYFLGIPCRILLQADQKIYVEFSLMIVANITYTILSIVMIQRGSSLILVKLMSATVVFAALICIWFYVKNCYHLYRTKKSKKIDLPMRKDAAIHSITNIIHENSDLVILTLFVDIKIISVYTVYYCIVGQIKKFMASFTGGMEAAFGNMWVRNERKAFRDRFRIYEFLILSLIIIVFSCVFNLLLPFIELYTSKVKDINYVLPVFAILITITELIFCIREPCVTIVFATGKYRETKNIAIIEAAVNVTVSFILVFKLGIYGVITGTLLANLIRTFYYVWFSSKYILRMKIADYIKRLFWFILTFSICVFIGSVIVDYLDINDWGTWFSGGVILFSLSGMITFISAFVFEKKSLLGLLKICKLVFTN